jgi:hypothetical protein
MVRNWVSSRLLWHALQIAQTGWRIDGSVQPRGFVAISAKRFYLRLHFRHVLLLVY